MKTNVSINLSDEQRSRLADLLDGKQTKRLATRKEVAALVTATAQLACELPLVTSGPVTRVGASPTVQRLKKNYPRWQYRESLSRHLAAQGNERGAAIAAEAAAELRP